MTSFRSLFGSNIPSKGRSVVARSNRLDGDGIAVSSKIVGGMAVDGVDTFGIP
jgi:hypothetical protein